jgi:NAD(P)-dependent dehydrogenase (short-subunit alcohol dehydrogenase family)
MDVTHEDHCQTMAAECLSRYGRIDILHNNVGIGEGDGGVSSITLQAWQKIIDVNLTSMLLTCKHVIPAMREQGQGVITNISSIAAWASTGMVAYKTSKAAILALTENIAMGNARFGIRANSILPGLMNTPMAIEGQTAGGDTQALIAKRDARVPLGRKMGTAWDVAQAAVFLASDEASFITGVSLAVDGGQSLRIG